MDDALIGVLALVAGYLAGSISFSRVVTRLVSPQTDLKATLVPIEGLEEKLPMSGVSPTSVRFQLGQRFGCLASILDMAKVAVPVAAFKILFPDSPAEFMAAIGGLLGHNWPLYHKFSGGYGLSAIFGALLVIEWTAVPVNLLGTLLFYYFFRQVHVATFGAVLLLVPWFLYLGYGGYGLLYVSLCSVAYFVRVLPDFRSFREIHRKKSKAGSVEQTEEPLTNSLKDHDSVSS